ncbi:MAG: flippase [Bdellovibrionales bacterium]|nr:flippase [Bdellovibrionales bacterium]
MFLGVFLSIWIARTLGPVDFGALNYAISLVGIFSIFSTLGLDGILVNRLLHLRSEAKGIDSEIFLLGSAISMRLFGSVVSLFLIFLYLNFFETGLGLEPKVLALMFSFLSLSLVIQAFDSVKHHFESIGNARAMFFPQMFGLVAAAIFRIIAIYANAGLAWFSFLILFEAFLTILLIHVSFYRTTKKTIKICFSVESFFLLLKDSWPLALSGLAVLIYTRVDSIILASSLGGEEVGIYSAALRLSEVWYFFPTIFSVTFFPRLFELHHADQAMFESKLTLLLRGLFITSFLISVVVSIFSDEIIQMIFGGRYSRAAEMLEVHIWTSVFVFMGVASGPWYLIKKLNHLLLFRTLFGALCNIVMNMILIPKLGAKGAAISALITQAVAAFFADYVNPQSRPLFHLKLRAMVPFVR